MNSQKHVYFPCFWPYLFSPDRWMSDVQNSWTMHLAKEKKGCQFDRPLNGSYGQLSSWMLRCHWAVYSLNSENRACPMEAILVPSFTEIRIDPSLCLFIGKGRDFLFIWFSCFSRRSHSALRLDVCIKCLQMASISVKVFENSFWPMEMSVLPTRTKRLNNT